VKENVRDEEERKYVRNEADEERLRREEVFAHGGPSAIPHSLRRVNVPEQMFTTYFALFRLSVDAMTASL
jgi:hypothetical protein